MKHSDKFIRKWLSFVALAAGCLFPMSYAAPAALPSPVLATAAEAPQAEAPQEKKKGDEALYAAMEAASTRDDYIAVLRQMADMPDYRQYEICNLSSPEQIPFEKLSAEQARESTLWFSRYKADVCVKEESLRYFADVLYPRYQAFLRKVSSREHIAQLTIPVISHSGYTTLDIKQKVNEVFKKEKLGFCILLIKPKVSSFRDIKEGDNVEVEFAYYELPEPYTAFLEDQRSSMGTHAVAMKLKDANGKEIRSYEDKVRIGAAFYRDGGCYIVNGFGMGHRPSTDIEFKEHFVYQAFSLPANTVLPEGGLTASATVVDPTPKFSPGDSSSGSTRPHHGPSGFCGIFASLAGLVVLLTLPFMIYAWVKEFRRRYVPLPMPEGWTPEQFNDEKLGEEFSQYPEFLEKLQKVNVEGQMLPVYTRRREVTEGFALLQKLQASGNTSPEAACILNDFGGALNQAQKRHLVGHWGVLIFGLIVFGVIAWVLFSDGDITYGLLTVAFMISYVLSLMCPAYLIANEEPWYCSWFFKCLKVVGLTWVTVSAGIAAGEYVTRWRDSQNRVWVERDEENTHVAIGLACIAFAVCMSPFVIMLISLNRFVRNYVAPK